MNREYVCLCIPELTDHGWEKFGQLLPHEEVVRCRDCAFSTSMGYQCRWFHGDYLAHAQVVPEGFCAWGERREA